MKNIYIIALSIIIAAGVVAFVVTNNNSTPETTTTDQTTAASTTDETTNPTTTETTADQITLEEVASHNSESDCWMAIDGKVYDVTSFFGRHPGGDDRLLQGCGTDATTAFQTQGGEGSHSSFAESQLAEFEIGTLAQ